MNDYDNFRIAFHIGNFNVSWYVIFAIIGIIVTFIAILYQARKRNFPLLPLENFFFLAFIFGIIGARAWFLIGNHYQIHNFGDIFAVWKGGIAIEGGVLLAFIVGFFYFSYVENKINVSKWKYFDVLLPNLFLMQAIGRWGNFFNGEILGPVVSSHSFLHTIIIHSIWNHLHLATNNGYIEYRQPFFLYESLLDFFFWVFLMKFIRTKLEQKILIKKNQNKKKLLKWKYYFLLNNGSKGAWWFILYGIMRTIMEPFRDEQDILKINNFQISVFLSACFVFWGIIILWYLNFNKLRTKKFKKLNYLKSKNIITKKLI